MLLCTICGHIVAQFLHSTPRSVTWEERHLHLRPRAAERVPDCHPKVIRPAPDIDLCARSTSFKVTPTTPKSTHEAISSAFELSLPSTGARSTGPRRKVLPHKLPQRIPFPPPVSPRTPATGRTAARPARLDPQRPRGPRALGPPPPPRAPAQVPARRPRPVLQRPPSPRRRTGPPQGDKVQTRKPARTWK